MTFGEYWPIFWGKKKGYVKDTTIAVYGQLWAVHLASYFGEIEMSAVKNSTFQKYVDGMVSAGKKVGLIRDSIVVVKNMLKLWALDNDLPIYAFTIIWPTRAAQSQQHREKYTDEEIRKLIDYCKQSRAHRDKVIALGAMTGLRIGELCGLRFGDFDYEHNTLMVSRTVGRLVWNEEGFSPLYVNTPKCGASERKVPIPDWLKDYFLHYQSLLGLGPDDYISKDQHCRNEFCEPRTLRPHFIRLCKRIGIPYRSFHSLRHSYASRLLAANVDVRTTAELLGHSDVQTTLNIYAHSDDNAKQLAAKKVFL